MTEFSASLVWSNAEGAFRLTHSGAGLELLCPDGQTLQMPLAAWQDLAKAVGEMVRRPARPKAPNHGKPWGKADTQKLGDLWQSGTKMSDIARQFGRSRGAISAKLEQMGLIAPFAPSPD